MNQFDNLFFDLRDCLYRKHSNNPSKLQAVLKDSLQRLLTYKEIALHAKELGEDVVSQSYNALKPLEKKLCDIGMDAMTFAINKLDSLLSLDWSNSKIPEQANC